MLRARKCWDTAEEEVHVRVYEVTRMDERDEEIEPEIESWSRREGMGSVCVWGGRFGGGWVNARKE